MSATQLVPARISAGWLCSGVGEMVHGARRDPYGVTGTGGHPPAADPEPHPAREHGEGLLLPGMRMAGRHPAARGKHEFPVQDPAPGLRRGPADHVGQRGIGDRWLGERAEATGATVEGSLSFRNRIEG